MFWFDWQQCGQHVKEIDYGGWPAPRNHMAMKQGYEVCFFALFAIILSYDLDAYFSILFLFQAKMNEHHHHNNLQKGKINFRCNKFSHWDYYWIDIAKIYVIWDFPVGRWFVDFMHHVICNQICYLFLVDLFIIIDSSQKYSFAWIYYSSNHNIYFLNSKYSCYNTAHYFFLL